MTGFRILLAIICCAATLRGADNVIISEFMAANSTTLRDEDGDAEDWIEVYNAGEAAVSLAGWHLTDMPDDLEKWTFPVMNLAANQFLIVFASNKDRRVPGTNLHTNFRLSAAGEFLALVRPDQGIATQFSPLFPPQVDNISYGLPVSAGAVPILSRGAPGQFFVPRHGALSTNWIFPEFNAAAWSNVTTGIGFDTNRVAVLTPVANSVSDWSTGAQGYRNWRYGYYNKSADPNATYSAAEFVPFPTNYWNGVAWRWPSPTSPWDTIGRTDVHPNGINSGAEHWVIRRWTATTNGTLSVTWVTRKTNPSGSGVTGKLFHNGVEKDSASIGGADVTGVTRTASLPGVNLGDQIDLALTPIGAGGATDDGSDGSYNSMSISNVSMLADFITSNVGAMMLGINSSAYLRVPFVVTNLAELDALQLRIRHDDGFVAYLNGIEVARRNAPAAVVGGDLANQTTDFGGAQGLNNWYYGFYDRTADADATYQAYTDFNNTDPLWSWSGSAWTLGPGDPPWSYIGAGSWHPNGDNSGSIQWVVRRWVSETEGTLEAAVTFAKENPNCGNGVTLRIFHNGAPRLTRTIAFHDGTGFSTNLVLNDVMPGDFIDFALDSLGTDNTRQDSCDSAALTINLTQDPSPGPSWNSAATAARAPAAVPLPEEFDLTRFRNFLVPGTNLLALHGLNAGTHDGDFLLQPELVATYFTVNPTQSVYFPAATPGAPNGSGVPSLGPQIENVSHAPALPNDADDLWVTARVTPTLHPVASITLRYRVMFGSEISVPMIDNGVSGAGPAGDRVYGAMIPASASAPGQMIRYYVSALDTNAQTLSSPLRVDPEAEQFFGTVVDQAALTNSRLAVLHWFMENPGLADTDAGGRGALFFLGEFYDNVRANIHGQSTRLFPKKSYDFELPRGHKLKWAEGQPRLSDFNFLTTWADKSHLRNVLAFETYSDNGVGSHFAFAMRVQQNGAFHSVANFVENGDEEYLERTGLDPRGALYKMYNSAQNTAGAEKKSRPQEGVADLQSLISGLSQPDSAARQAYLFDHLDLPATVNYLANMTLAATTDCCHKNYYLYHDNEGSDEWLGLPWDQDLTFGRVWTCGNPCYHYFDEILYTNTSIYFGSGNTVFGPIFESPATRQMYLRRLRTLLDSMMQPPGTPATNDFYRLKTRRLRDQIAPDAALDLAKWGSWGMTNDRNITGAVNRIWNEYLPGRRLFLYSNQVAGRGGEIPAAQPGNAVVNFGIIEFRPASGNQRQEYFCLTNPNSYAVDLSGWSVSGGARFTFKGGTVIPANSVAYVSPDRRSFRQRPVPPSGGQQLLVLGDYDGNLSAWGETLVLTDARGSLVASNSFPGTPSPVQQFLRITEIMYHPAPFAENANGAQAFEYLELKNISTTVPLSLDGVRLTNGVFFDFTGGAVPILAPGARVLVVANSNAFVARYGESLPLAGEYAGALERSGEELQLIDSFGERVLDFSYDNAWHPLTDGHGFSLVIVNENAPWFTWGEPARWRASGALDGAPGREDPPPPSFAPVLISEALTHTDLPEVDAIELFNPTDTPVDVGGWFLSDDFATPKKFRIPCPTVLPAGGFAMFTETHFNPTPGAPPSFSLSSAGDEVWLFSGDATTNLSGYMHGWSFDAAQNGVTFGRYVSSQGEEDFVAQSTNSLGASNAYPRVGPVIVSEVMYHPTDDGTNDNTRDEFIELHNITASPVPLFDPIRVLNTWRLRRAVEFDFPTNITLPPGGHLLVVGFAPNDAGTTAAFREGYGLTASVPLLGPWRGKLRNSADTLELKCPDAPEGTNVPYLLVEKLAYQDTAPWPVTPDGEGTSLQRRRPTGYGNDVTNWFASSPTPGTTNRLNLPPMVTLTHPPPDAVFQSPVNVTLQASASDPDGAILRVEFFADGAKLAEDTTAPFSTVWSNVPPGPHTLYARARDNSLSATTSTSNNIVVVSRPPVVTLTSPTNLSLLPAGSNVTLYATATASDGFIALVEIFDDATQLIETTSPPYTFAWSSPLPGVHRLSAVATDDTGRRATSAVVTVAVSTALATNVSLVATGALWKFLDDGSNPGNAWTNPAFADGAWSSGRAQLGFGEDDETTLLRRTNAVTGGTNITFYFRLKFQVTNANEFDSVLARVVRDDGAIGWLNGGEILRSSMPAGAVNYLTPASVTAGTAFEETNFFPFPFRPAPLVERTNILAVEIHQVSTASPDLSFQLELLGQRLFLAPVIVTPPASQAVPLGGSVTLSAVVLGTPPARLQWRYNATPIAGATNSTFQRTNVQFSHLGAYDVVASNSVGSTTSVVALLTLNRPPTPGPDGLPVLRNEPASRSLESLLMNDTDPDGDVLSVYAVAATSTNGAAVSVMDDRFTYAPRPNFTGADLFTYTAGDSHGAVATGRVEVLVVAAPLPPVNQIVLVPSGSDRRLRFLGAGDQAYALQRSIDLTTWMTLHSTNAPPHGIIEYLDPTPPPGQAFYRVSRPGGG